MRLLLIIVCTLLSLHLHAQELDATVKVNAQTIPGSDKTVFERLETALTAFINERRWTEMQFAPNERIRCNFNLTITAYNKAENKIDANLLVQASRPVFGSTYTSTTFSTQDKYFSFSYSEFDNLEFRSDVIDNDLTALIAYYAYLLIGVDLDTMSPLGGTEILRQAQSICTNAQSLPLSMKGWQSFADAKNRFAIINDWLDSGMEPFRQMQYRYYRKGLDTMAENAERGRAAITEALMLLNTARDNKPMSMLPQIFTEYKRDELVSIYKGKGASSDKEQLYEMLMRINASQNNYWTQLKQ